MSNVTINRYAMYEHDEVAAWLDDRPYDQPIDTERVCSLVPAAEFPGIWAIEHGTPGNPNNHTWYTDSAGMQALRDAGVTA